ncbi:MAG: hypothetical protein H6R01_1811 [Burkholderiaceae bacterium]|nr:hypothetical protein [Burkholderiaceae bacterium]
MKLQPADQNSFQHLTACDDNSVTINGMVHEKSLIVMPHVGLAAWPVTSFDALTASDLMPLAEAAPDVVLLGTGRRQRFVRPELTATLFERRIGIECMDNRAACRTYHLLSTEGRKVALALIFDAETSDYSGV